MRDERKCWDENVPFNATKAEKQRDGLIIALAHFCDLRKMPMALAKAIMHR